MKIEENFDLTLYNSYRLKAKCKRAFFPECEEDFITIYREYTGSPKIILGGGYNVILSKEEYEDDFIIIGESFSKVEFHDLELVVEAGRDLKSLSELALVNGLTGMEIFYDIPSSMGGAVVMNAGASGEDIKGILIKVRYLDLDSLTINEITNEQINFEYRNSFFQKSKNTVVLKVWLRLQRGSSNLIKDKMESIKEARWSKQPKEFPNAGSVFKRPEGFYVGSIIEELNLKGFTVGGAMISKKHGGFIVNWDNATGKDILELIRLVQEKIQDAYNVVLEIEQRII